MHSGPFEEVFDGSHDGDFADVDVMRFGFRVRIVDDEKFRSRRQFHHLLALARLDRQTRLRLPFAETDRMIDKQKDRSTQKMR